MKQKKYLVILLIIIAIGAFFLPPFRTVSPFDRGKTNLVVGGEYIEAEHRPMVQNGEVLMPFSIVKEYFDPTVHWDEKAHKIVFTTAEKVVTMKTDNLTAMVNAKPMSLNIPAKVLDGEPYLPIQFISELLQINVQWQAGNNAVVIDKKVPMVKIAKITVDKPVMRSRPTFWSPRLPLKDKKGSELRLFGEEGNWYLVRTNDGLLGYIAKKSVTTKEIATKDTIQQYVSQAPWKPKTGKINLVWEAVYSKNPDTSKIEPMPGLDVVSPTWFALTDGKGTISNLGDKRYVDWAHNNGYKVWALINSFDPDMTHEALGNTDYREKIINQMLVYAKLYQLDGINIDFENVYLKDKNMLTQFVREMTPLMHEQGLTVSMDVTIKSLSANWSLCYDRAALAKSLDYMALMAYDQYYSKSEVAGSVAQLSWVEESLKAVLEEVPSEKLLLGMPFYMRQWKEEKVNGKTVLSSKAISMETMQKIIEGKKPKMIWDKESGQYYAEYKEGKATYKIWVEDEKSINLKSSLAHKYELAGVASWRRGFESQPVWNVLNANMKQIKDYTAWSNANN